MILPRCFKTSNFEKSDFFLVLYGMQRSNMVGMWTLMPVLIGSMSPFTESKPNPE